MVTTWGRPVSSLRGRPASGLIITCDCGITAVAAVEQARAAGIDVIITDHHLPGAELPAAVAIINPQRPDDQSDLKQLCGTGVAFKLVQALVPALGLPVNLPYHLLDLVAMATIADIVPLTAENRIMVRHGLKLISETRWVGLRALVKVAGTRGPGDPVGQVGFVLGPRLNAAGRVGDAQDGLRLLLTDDEAEADNLAPPAGRAQRPTAGARSARFSKRPSPRSNARSMPNTLPRLSSRPRMASRGRGHRRLPSRRTLRAADLSRRLRGRHRQELGPQHLPVQFACSAAALRRPAGAIRRSPHGGRRYTCGAIGSKRFRERFISVARESLAPEDLGPEQRVDLVLELTEVSADLERLLPSPRALRHGESRTGLRCARSFAEWRATGRWQSPERTLAHELP